MKKRLFISSILMTLVLLVAITTATFAWYTASGMGGKIKASESEKQTISAANPSYTVEAQELPVYVKITRLGIDGTGTSSANLELGTYTTINTTTKRYDANGTAGFYHAYIDGNNIARYDNQNSESLEDFAVYKVEIMVQSTDYTDTATGTVWSPEQIKTALRASGNTITVTVNQATADSSRAKFYAKAETPAVPTAAGGTSLVLGTNVALTSIDLSNQSVPSALTFYFCLYVEGENGSLGAAQTSDNNTTPNGNFVVNVTKYVANNG